MTTIILRSSYADITCDRETGNIISIDYENFGGDGNEWDDVAYFDHRDFTTEPEMDVLDVGYMLKDGRYFTAARTVKQPRG